MDGRLKSLPSHFLSYLRPFDRDNPYNAEIRKVWNFHPATAYNRLRACGGLLYVTKDTAEFQRSDILGHIVMHPAQT